MNRAPLIVHVVYRFDVGGLENGLVNLINRLPVDEWRHAILSLTEISSRFASRIARDDVRCIELGKRPGHLVRDYPRIHRMLRSLAPAVVHTRNLAALEAVVPAWTAGVPVRIHSEHGWDMADPHGTRARYRLVRRLYRPFVTRYVALSRHLQRYLASTVAIPEERLSQVYNGVDTDRFRPAERRTPIPGCPFGAGDEWLIGWVGRMERIKDPLTLARAFVLARRRSALAARRLRLVLVGDGALREEVRAFLERHDALGHTWFAGERSDIDAVMRGLDCFALPSLAEGISNTILEAMASRLPIVATAVGGNGELIESGLSGRIVPSADSAALAQGLLHYFGDRATARRHAKAARHAAETRFSLSRMVFEYASLYQRSLREAGIGLAPALSSR